MSFDRLISRIDELKNPTVVGLDPLLDYIPEYIKNQQIAISGKTLKAAADSILIFNKAIIDNIFDIVPAVKPQCAYYELYGWEGMRALSETIKYAREKGMFVISDGKRNDIGSTMQAYSTAFLSKSDVCGEKLSAFESDALTVNGYLGSDGINPLLKDCKENDKGIFILVKTSNPSSGELQDKKIGDKTVYETMGEMVEGYGSDNIGKYGYSCVGAVVGATYKEQLFELREKMPHTMFLVPGYGAQGGGVDDIIGGFDKEGRGAIINSSRAVLTAYKKGNYDEKDFAKAARDEAIRMRDEIRKGIYK